MEAASPDTRTFRLTGKDGSVFFVLVDGPNNVTVIQEDDGGILSGVPATVLWLLLKNEKQQPVVSWERLTPALKSMQGNAQNVQRHISHLRQFLGCNKNSPVFIETVGNSYRIVAQAEEVSRDSTIVESNPNAALNARKRWSMGIGILILILVPYFWLQRGVPLAEIEGSIRKGDYETAKELIEANLDVPSREDRWMLDYYRAEIDLNTCRELRARDQYEQLRKRAASPDLESLATVGQAASEYALHKDADAKQLYNAVLEKQDQIQIVSRVESMIGMGRVALGDSDYELAQVLLEQARIISINQRWFYQQASATLVQARVALARDDDDVARQSFNDAMGLANEHGFNTIKAKILADLGQLDDQHGETKLAISRLEEAEALNRSMGLSCKNSFSGWKLADIHFKAGDYEAAKKILVLIRPDARGEDLAFILMLEGDVASRFENYDEATKLLSQARDIFSELNHRAVSYATDSLGFVYAEIEDYSRAVDTFSQAVAEAQTHRDAQAESNALIHLGLIYLELRQCAKSQESLDRAHDLVRDRDQPLDLANVLTAKGELAIAQGELNRAFELIIEAERLPIGTLGKANAERALSYYYEATGNNEQAQEYVARARENYAKNEQAGQADVRKDLRCDN